MMEEQLLKSASKLVPPSQAALKEFSQLQDQLAAMGNQAMARRPDLEKLVGKDNQAMAEDNNRNFARFMVSLLTEFNPKVLVETVLWVFRAYRSHGFQTTYWAANLDIWAEMLRQELSKEAFEAIYPFYHWLIINIPIFVKITDDNLTEPLASSKPSHG